jgi:hypothetical protein
VPIGILILVRKSGEASGECITQGSYTLVNDEVDSDSKMSVERFDDVVAALTFTATVVTITLGFLFNL